MLVKFLKPHDGYNGGEVAAFSDAYASNLIARKIAEPHAEEEVKKEEKREPKKVVATVMKSPGK